MLYLLDVDVERARVVLARWWTESLVLVSDREELCRPRVAELDLERLPREFAPSCSGMSVGGDGGGCGKFESDGGRDGK